MISINDAPAILLSFANEREIPSGYLLSLEKERKGINDALADFQDKQLCQIHDEPSTSIDELFDNFGRYRDKLAIFHYGGHAGGTGVMLEDGEGGSLKANTKGLAYLLGQQEGLKLVFLNGCSTRGQVAEFIQAGVAAVIATSTAINDKMAGEFAIQFYESLASGASIQDAFNEAKARIMSYDNAPEIHQQEHRVLMFEDNAENLQPLHEMQEIPWGLYAAPHADLDWKLPSLIQNVVISKRINVGELQANNGRDTRYTQTFHMEPSDRLHTNIQNIVIEQSFEARDAPAKVEAPSFVPDYDANTGFPKPETATPQPDSVEYYTALYADLPANNTPKIDYIGADPYESLYSLAGYQDVSETEVFFEGQAVPQPESAAFETPYYGVEAAAALSGQPVNAGSAVNTWEPVGQGEKKKKKKKKKKIKIQIEFVVRIVDERKGVY